MKKSLFIFIVILFVLSSFMGNVGAQDGTEDVVEIVIPKKYLVVNDYTASEFCAHFAEEDGFVACEEMEDFEVLFSVTQEFQANLIQNEINAIDDLKIKIEGIEDLSFDVELNVIDLYIDMDSLTEENFYSFYNYFVSYFYNLNVFQGLGNENVSLTNSLFDFETKELIKSHDYELLDLFPDLKYVEITFTNEDLERIGKTSEVLAEEFSLQSGFISSSYDVHGNWVMVISEELQQKLMYQTNTLFFAYVFQTDSEDQNLGVFGSDETGYFFSIDDEDIPVKPNSLEFGYVDEQMYDYVFYVETALFNSDEEQAMIKFVESILPDYWLYAKQPTTQRFAVVYFVDNENQDPVKIIFIPESAFGYSDETFEFNFIADEYSSFEEFAKESIENGFIYVYIDADGNYIAVGSEEKLEELIEGIHLSLIEIVNPDGEDVQIVENEDFTEFQVLISSDLFTEEMEVGLTERLIDMGYAIHSMTTFTEKDHFTIEFVDVDSGEVLKTIEETLIFE